MYIEDYKQKLDRNIIRIGNVDYYPASNVNDVLYMLSNSCIRWDEDDFESVAIQRSNETEWEQYYDKNKFGYALYEMIRHHDASIGITWDTISFYLEEFCKIKEYKNLYDNNKILK